MEILFGGKLKVDSDFEQQLATVQGYCLYIYGVLCRVSKSHSQANPPMFPSGRIFPVVLDEAHLSIGLIQRAEKQYRLALKSAEAALTIDPEYDLAIDLREDLLEVIRVTA